MLKIITLILSSVLTSLTFAASIVDVYGTSSANAARLLHHYGIKVAEIESMGIKIVENYPNIDLKNLNRLKNEKQKLIESIKRQYHFSFVDFQTVNYPDKDDRFTTIEVVEPNHKERLRYVDVTSEVTRHLSQQKVGAEDIIQSMQNYETLTLQLIMNHEEPAEVRCPAYHCLSSFKNEKLKPYLALFNQAALQQKKYILNTLKHDKNPERRASAVLLVGHFQNPHDIIRLLLPHVNDHNSGVRNNVLRVIGDTAHKANINDMDLNPILKLLDSPYGTDRNKALFILLTNAELPHTKKMLIHHGKDQLLSILALKQPNNHHMAYLILQKISGQKFGEYDIAAWNNWWIKAQKRI